MTRLKRNLLATLTLIATSATLAGVAPGDSAPPLVIETWHNTDVPLTLDDLAGQVVLLDFWGVWCGPCRDAVPVLQELQQQFQDRPFRIVSIHTPMKADQIESFIAEHRMTVAIGVDTAPSTTRKGPYGKTSDEYGVSSFPTYVLIDAHSRVHTVGEHIPDRDIIEKLLPGAGRP